MKQLNTSWQKAGKQYDDSVGERGHYYHQHVVIPGVLPLLNLREGDKLLDLACGQGILARQIPDTAEYVGIDTSTYLIDQAERLDRAKNHRYFHADATKQLPFPDRDFTHAACILALQNIQSPDKAVSTAGYHLKTGGTLVIVLNHPAFRIPRQSSWGIDEQNKIQYRKVNRYMSPLKIPINMHPGEEKGPITWSFHNPLQDYFAWLVNKKFVVTGLEEWTSDKESVGKAARMENRGRNEIPLFMAIKAEKRG